MKYFLKKSKVIIQGILILIAIPVFADNNALEIMKKNYALKHPDSVKNSSVMFILQGGTKEVKEFNLFSKKFQDHLRMRLSIIKPISLDFISWSVPGKAAKQWINLGKEFKEIASGDMSGSFLGSHFTYSDLAEPYLDDYLYNFLGESKVNEDDCFKIEAIKKDGLSPYKKTVIYIRKADYYMVQVDFYEKKGHTKTLTMEKIEVVKGIITARKITMAKTGSKDKTIIVLKNIDYNVPVEENRLIPVASYQ
jgi:outer membrane lipoprotein-sorting protein